MALGLMRTAAAPLGYVTATSGGGSSSSRRGSWGSSRSIPKPWMLLLCLGVGYWLGASHTRVVPYPLDQEAYLPPPKDLPLYHPQQQQQQQQVDADGIVKPPAIPGDGSSSSISSSSSLMSHMLTQQLLTPQMLQQLHPPVTPGRSGDASYTAAPFQVLSWYPRVILFPNFLSTAQAQYFRSLAEGKLQPSELGALNAPFHPSANKLDGKAIRSSHGVFLDRTEDPSGFLGWLEERIGAVTMIPPSHGEDFNILRYNAGQHYNGHMDTFDPHTLAHNSPHFGQRMATFLMYLSDVEEGGETVFRFEGKYGALRDAGDLSTCNPEDFKVKPRIGDAILFWSLNHDLSINPRSMHGACPVVKGEKWVATKWLHDRAITEWDGEARH